MALFMSCVMSLVISIYNIGIVENIIAIWFNAWGFSFIIAFPTVMIVSPLVGKVVSLILSKE